MWICRLEANAEEVKIDLLGKACVCRLSGTVGVIICVQLGFKIGKICLLRTSSTSRLNVPLKRSNVLLILTVTIPLAHLGLVLSEKACSFAFCDPLHSFCNCFVVSLVSHPYECAHIAKVLWSGIME
jgi:hypothetical protein